MLAKVNSRSAHRYPYSTYTHPKPAFAVMSWLRKGAETQTGHLCDTRAVPVAVSEGREREIWAKKESLSIAFDFLFSRPSIATLPWKSRTDALDSTASCILINWQLPYALATPVPGFCSREMKTYVHIKTCTWIFIASLFIKAKVERNWMSINWRTGKQNVV